MVSDAKQRAEFNHGKIFSPFISRLKQVTENDLDKYEYVDHLSCGRQRIQNSQKNPSSLKSAYNPLWCDVGNTASPFHHLQSITKGSTPSLHFQTTAYQENLASVWIQEENNVMIYVQFTLVLFKLYIFY